jgi:hypothetical protein
MAPDHFGRKGGRQKSTAPISELAAPTRRPAQPPGDPDPLPPGVVSLASVLDDVLARLPRALPRNEEGPP